MVVCLLRAKTIVPLGDAPRAKVRLTPEGTEFTEWHLPAEYEVVFRDGRSVTVSAEYRDKTVAGDYEPQLRCTFEAEINGEAFTFVSALMYYESSRSCLFCIGHTGTARTEDGQIKAFEHFVSGEECDTQVDQGGAFNYLVHRINYFFRSIRYFFENPL